MTLQFNAKGAPPMPAAARAFGIGGLIPFAGGAFAVCFAPEIKAQAATEERTVAEVARRVLKQWADLKQSQPAGARVSA